MTAPTRRLFIVATILALYLVALYGPVLLLPLFSFNDNIYTVFPLSGFTLKWYQQLGHEVSLVHSLWASLKVGIAVALIGTIFGFLAAKAMTRYRIPGRRVLYGFLLLPLIVPPIIKGASLLSFFRQYLDIQLSLWTVGAAHVMVAIPFAMLVLIARIESFDRNLEEASADLGMSAWQTFRRITLPLALPGIISSLLLCFIVSFDEFMLAFFLSGNEPTLPIYMYGLLRFPDSMPTVLALGTVILVSSVVLITATEILRSQRRATDRA
jgi:spermidine/putrescine transport system permease protein